MFYEILLLQNTIFLFTVVIVGIVNRTNFKMTDKRHCLISNVYNSRYHIESFETLVGRKFLSFAKSAMFNDDLYSGLVAEVLQSDLLVESWTNGPGTLDSECSRNFQ